MILEPWILEAIDETTQEAVSLPVLDREAHFAKKAAELQREALHAGRSLQETKDLGATFLAGARLLA